MLFNSYFFIFVFLPATLAIYFLLNSKRLILAGKAWLILASLYFYSFFTISYLPLILISIIVNFVVGNTISSKETRINKNLMLYSGIFFNLGLLGYFKYYDFFIQNINILLGVNIKFLNIALPLGISFFTFTQIAFLVDNYRAKATEYDFLSYVLFVTFFPHLIAGPIIHHQEMMPQFNVIRNKVLNYKNIAFGLYLFSIGLFKKTILADTFALWASDGFDMTHTLTFYEAWITALSYTFQLYFDFSGYTDMALGLSWMFNIKLPLNFNSPYKSLNIQEFWRKWHMTLSRFLLDYIYIPLGGSRSGNLSTHRNLLMTFIIGGIWHGAGWTFILWGSVHGIGLIIHRIWMAKGFKMNTYLAWFLTFNCVNIGWVFFRARNWAEAMKVIKGMFGFNGFKFFTNENMVSIQPIYFNLIIGYIILGFIICLCFQNTNYSREKFVPNWKSALIAAILFVLSLSNINKISEFLYFNF